MKKSFQHILTMAVALMITSATALWADGNPGDYLHTRTYIGVVGTSISVSNNGLFSGNNFSVVNSPAYDLALVPSLSSAIGWGFELGHREEAYALEVSYWQSNHNASFGPGVVTSNGGNSTTLSSAVQGTATYNSINVDFKRYFLTDLQLQPFLNLGVTFPWITVSDGDIDGLGTLHDLTLAGIGLDLGVGLEYYVTPNLSFTAGAYQRWASFNEFSGSQVEYNTLTTSSGDGSGLNFAVGATLGVE